MVGALSLAGYQLLVDIAGVGAGRLGPQAFLLIAPEPEGTSSDALTHISLHQTRLGNEREAYAYQQLAAQLGYLRLSGYRLGLERSGLRSKISLVNPATGAIAMQIPDKHPGRLFGGGRNVASIAGDGTGAATRRVSTGPSEPRAAAAGVPCPGAQR